MEIPWNPKNLSPPRVFPTYCSITDMVDVDVDPSPSYLIAKFYQKVVGCKPQDWDLLWILCITL